MNLLLKFFSVLFLKSSKIKKGSKGDLSVLKPTLMAAVPVNHISKLLLEEKLVIFNIFYMYILHIDITKLL